MTGAEANGPEADDGEGKSTSETRDGGSRMTLI